MKQAVNALLLGLLCVGLFSNLANAESGKRRKSAPVANTQDSESASNNSSSGRSGGVSGEPDTDGCGLGWQVTDKKTIAASITRGTTNGTVPPSFGMSSGTLGCAKHPFAKRDQAGVVYAATNFDALSLEMARGQGEYLDGFARVFGCSDAKVSEFNHMVQTQYRTISEGGKANAVRLYLNVKKQVQIDPVLHAHCSA